ncbi:hypothetical protein AVEN_246306-1 [Araneus ventricosus]|uniref:DDE-1 domain-containing protein n=1 Tax=Araneus ventricosus TaxID=182803 RepID=A0A4Y2QW95_ARAVE|nr:hypothetical protein AVEN_246306-1 [Araneus ventricosus]
MLSATRVFVPPALILVRERMNPLLCKDAPNGTLPLISGTSYMNSCFFIDWLKHSVKHAKPSTEDPLLLIADNHTFHCSLPTVCFVERIYNSLLLFHHIRVMCCFIGYMFLFCPLKLYTHLKLKNCLYKTRKSNNAVQSFRIFSKVYSGHCARVQLAEKAFLSYRQAKQPLTI